MVTKAAFPGFSLTHSRALRAPEVVARAGSVGGREGGARPRARHDRDGDEGGPPWVLLNPLSSLEGTGGGRHGRACESSSGARKTRGPLVVVFCAVERLTRFFAGH